MEEGRRDRLAKPEGRDSFPGSARPSSTFNLSTKGAPNHGCSAT